MAGTGIFRAGRELTAKEVKQEIMQIRGWDEAEYTRQRKQLTKRITTFNALMQASGQPTETRTSVQMLYGESRAIKRHGVHYQPSSRTAAVRSMAATSGRARGAKAIEKARTTYGGYVTKRFAGLIASNKGAAEIAKRIKDPVKLEAALTKYANDMHQSIDRKKTTVRGQAIPFSTESYGSDTYDVDISAYLDDDEDIDTSELQEVNPDDIFE